MTTEEYIKYCSHMINEGWNPDDPANDDLDKMADDWENEQKEKEKISKENKKNSVAKEAMSVDDILKKHAEKIQSQKRDNEYESNIKRVIFKEPPYDGYQNCIIEYKNGQKKDIEFDVGGEEINDMLAKLNAKCKKRKFVKIPTQEDAIVAIIRLRLDPDDNLKWFFGEKKNVSLDKWFLNKELEDEMLDKKFDQQWEKKQKMWDMYSGSGDDTYPDNEDWTDVEKNFNDPEDDSDEDYVNDYYQDED